MVIESSAPPSPSVANQSIDLSSPALDAAMQKNRYSSRSSTSLVKSILNPVISLLPRLGGRRRQSQPEGLIAPRTPIRGSPLHTPVQMPNAYFPWGGDDISTSNSNSNSNSGSASGSVSGSGTIPSRLNLTPSSLGLGRPRTPPPPRRVQSEMMTSGLNPRGLATRNGIPAVPDSKVMTDEPDDVDLVNRRIGLGSAGRSTPKRPESPSMSLGPRGNGIVGGAEVIEVKGQAEPKRKND